MRFPIRYQLMLPMLAVAIAGLTAVGVGSWVLSTRGVTERIEGRLRGVIGVLNESTFPLTDPVLQQMGGLAGAGFVLTDAEGRRVASSEGFGDLDLRADERTARSVEQVALGRELRVGGATYLHSSVWLRRRGSVAARVLHVLFAQDEYESAWRAAFLPPVLVGVVTVAAVAAVMHLAAGRVSGVLRSLGRDVQKLAGGDFSGVRPPRWDDETRDLALSVNQTAERLAEYESQLLQAERLRTVSMLGAGLAHEMRNAATGCRLAVDLHAESCGAAGGDDSLHVARGQLALMEGRLRQLLQLGQQPATAESEAVDFAELVSRSVELIAPAARHAGVRVEWDRPSAAAVVRADGELLGQAVMNVLLNALDAASRSRAVSASEGLVSEGLVSVALDSGDEGSELVVSDSGDGPSEAAGEDVFEPFVTTKAEGVGLGLAVAKRVVETFGGRIGWDRRDGWTRFRISLPNAASSGATHG